MIWWCGFSKEFFISVVINVGYGTVFTNNIVVCIAIRHLWVTWFLAITCCLLYFMCLPDARDPIVPNRADWLSNKPTIRNIILFFTTYHISICVEYIHLVLIQMIISDFIVRNHHGGRPSD